MLPGVVDERLLCGRRLKHVWGNSARSRSVSSDSFLFWVGAMTDKGLLVFCRSESRVKQKDDLLPNQVRKLSKTDQNRSSQRMVQARSR